MDHHLLLDGLLNECHWMYCRWVMQLSNISRYFRMINEAFIRDFFFFFFVHFKSMVQKYEIVTWPVLRCWQTDTSEIFVWTAFLRMVIYYKWHLFETRNGLILSQHHKPFLHSQKSIIFYYCFRKGIKHLFVHQITDTSDLWIVGLTKHTHLPLKFLMKYRTSS